MTNSKPPFRGKTTRGRATGGKTTTGVIIALLFLFISICSPVATQAQQKGYDQSLLKGLQWRSIGPFRGGRSTAVAGVTSQPNAFYFGATGGGLWKTIDGGITWEP